VAGVAAMVALGSAAAYALGLPDLPVELPGVELEVPLDLPQPLIPPPDVQLPSPIVGPPDGDEVPDAGDELGDLLEDLTAGAAATGTGPRPAAKPKDDVEKALDEAEADWEDLLAGHEWDDWAEWEDVDGGGRVNVGGGVNIGNGDNIKVIVDIGSDGNTDTVEQRNAGNDVVTCVEGGDDDESGC
jgi:hypothetical protein